MFGKIVKGAALIGLGYVIYKLGYGNGLRKADSVLQDLGNQYVSGKLSPTEYLSKVSERIKVIEGGN